MTYSRDQALLTLFLFIAVVMSAFSGVILILFAPYDAVLWISVITLGTISGYEIILQRKRNARSTNRG